MSWSEEIIRNKITAELKRGTAGNNSDSEISVSDVRMVGENAEESKTEWWRKMNDTYNTYAWSLLIWQKKEIGKNNSNILETKDWICRSKQQKTWAACLSQALQEEADKPGRSRWRPSTLEPRSMSCAGRTLPPFWVSVLNAVTLLPRLSLGEHSEYCEHCTGIPQMLHLGKGLG